MQTVKIDRFLRLGIGVLAVVLVYIIYTSIHQRVVEANDMAPQFSITADNGRTVSLPNFGGKVLLLNFWASWCGPCVAETPSLSKLAQDYASKGLVVLGVSVDKDPQAYQNFLRKYTPGFLTACDLKIHEDYGTYMYPETYIINAQGRVLLKIAEPADWTSPTVTQIIDKLL